MTNAEREQVEDIIRQVKGPYPAFARRIRLRELVQILAEVWEEDEQY